MQKTGIYGKIFAAWILAALMLVSACLSFRAVRTAEQTGSIEIQLPLDAQNVEMSLYAVAAYQNGGYHLTKEFADSKLEIIQDFNDAQKVQELVKGLTAFIHERGLAGTAAKPDRKGLVKFSGLAPALYMVVQSAGEMDINIQTVLVPIPYQGEGGTVIYDAMILPKYEYPCGDTLVTKLDDEGYALAGAEFILQQKVYLSEGVVLPEGAVQESDDIGAYYWKEYVTNLVSDENGQIVIRDMPRGEYRLVEVNAPEGFIRDTEPKYFSVDTFGKVTKLDGVYVPDKGEVNEVSVTNTPTSLKVEKVDPDGKRLPGAKLMVKTADGGMILDADGNPLYIFTSGEEPTVLKRLPAGEYLITELEAPEGFKISPDVKVTVSDELNADNHVTITDEWEEQTSYSITVEKALVDLEGVPVFAQDGVFYVALFSDAEHTRRVSPVRPIYFHGESTSSVTFENLTKGTKYYVGETDEYGNYIEGDLGEEGSDTYYVPFYPDDTSVTVDEETGETIFYFENVFSRIPDGYYYSADVIVTKKVLKGTKEYETDNVYYCALFYDKECTDRMGDVVQLSMEGSSEISVTIPVAVKNTESPITYYIRETDQNGVPLENTRELGFTVKQDKEKVMISCVDNKAEVVITNTYETKLTPKPSMTPMPDENTPSPIPPAPRTGDNTNITLYVILLLIAAAAGIIVFIGKQKR